MSINITERLVGMWFMNLRGDLDFLAGLEATDTGFKLTYRFRYGSDPEPWSDKDVKNWYVMNITKHSKSEAITKLHALIHMLESRSGHQCDELLMRNGDTQAFIRELNAKKWAHMKFEPI